MKKVSVLSIVRESIKNSFEEEENNQEKYLNNSYKYNQNNYNYVNFNNDNEAYLNNSYKDIEKKDSPNSDIIPNNLNNFYFEVKSNNVKQNNEKYQKIYKYKQDNINKDIFPSNKNINNNYIQNNTRLITHETSVSNMYQIDQFFEMGNYYMIIRFQ